MAKDKLTEYSATNASNDVIGDISVAEGMLPSAVNNALREQMTHLKNFSDGTDGINVLSLADDDASASIKIQAPSAVTTTTTLTLPDGDGDAGAMLQTNGSGQLAWSTAYRNRNLVLNGACAISQRATSVSSVTSGGYKTVDRFGLTLNSSGTFTVSQSSTAPEGFGNSLKFDCTTADASPDYFIIEHKIEGQNLQQLKKGTSNAESVTLSFYVRSSKTGTYQVNLRDNDNSRQIGSTYAISSANTFERKEITFAGDSTGAFDNDNASSLEIEWWLAAGSTYNSGAVPTAWEAQSNGDRAAGLNVAIGASTSDDFHITGVQLEIGEQATPFEHRSFGDELAACQRYYQKSYPDSVVAGSVSQLGAHMVYIPTTGNTFRYTLVFEDQMRANPTATFYVPETGTAGFGGYEANGDANKEAISSTFLSNKSYLLYNTGMGLVGSFYWQYQLDAEL